MSKKITTKDLKKLGFVLSTNDGDTIYYNGDYGLKYELNNWLIVANHSGIELTGMTAIETIDELKKSYKESTGKELTIV